MKFSLYVASTMMLLMYEEHHSCTVDIVLEINVGTRLCGTHTTKRMPMQEKARSTHISKSKENEP